MKKNVLLYILLAFLVAMNGFFLFKHFSGADTQGVRERGPGKFITNQLEFNEAQTIAFEKIELEHRKRLEAILDEIKVAKEKLFDKLSDTEVDQSEIEAKAKVIANAEAAKDLETFYFFKSVRELCNEDQKERFEAIIKDAMRRPGPPGRNGPPDRRGPPPGRDGPDGRPDRPNRPPPDH